MDNQLNATGFPTTESLLSPILLGLRRDNSTFDFNLLAARGAASAMPVAKVQLNLLFQGKKKVEAVEHNCTPFHGNDQFGNRLVRLCHQRPGEDSSASWPRWLWEVSCGIVPNPNVEDSMPEIKTWIRIVVTNYRITSGRIDSSVQLAFFRHMMVEGLRGIDPDLIVVGGQHDWKDIWWTPKSVEESVPS